MITNKKSSYKFRLNVNERNQEKILLGAGIGFQKKKGEKVDKSKREKEFLAIGMNFINDKAGWLIPVIMGTFTPLFIMTGMYYYFAPIQQIQYATLGYGTILGSGMLSSIIAQKTERLVVGLKTKNKSLKQLSLSSNSS
ncbi:CAT RNA binding domain-containing protein [Clostridium sp.]|uniref:CAT RNA binding domain-containing protein n=1 Tax=Clostridium sp. TaxID=1506 RepID=UPI0025BEC68D|nr:CAT RNA binding domain-containing protein [Clostridium sp.]